MKLNIRRLKPNDWETLDNWWKEWDGWDNPGKDFLPENGTGGFIVENENKPVLAGFIYTTNSKVIWLDWIISDPNYREKNRKEAIELLINASENVCRTMGYKYVFSLLFLRLIWVVLNLVYVQLPENQPLFCSGSR